MLRMRAIFGTLVLVGTLAGLDAQSGALPRDPIALTNANVLNVLDGTVQRNVTVTLRDGRIEAIAATPAPTGMRAINVRERYVVPGLIDAHVHIANLRALRTALESGVTTVRSSGVSHYVDVGMRELVKPGHVIGADVVASGYHVRPLVAQEAFFDHPAEAALMRGVTTVNGLRRMVQANLSRGVDWIKVLATERAGLPNTDPRKQVYTEEELRAVVDEAKTKGVPVQAHAHGAEGALAAVKAGVRSIEHGTYLGFPAKEGTRSETALGVELVQRHPSGQNGAVERRAADEVLPDPAALFAPPVLNPTPLGIDHPDFRDGRQHLVVDELLAEVVHASGRREHLDHQQGVDNFRRRGLAGDGQIRLPHGVRIDS